jgi:Na+/H+ antiporter NhaD/arsenite permease-like protein
VGIAVRRHPAEHRNGADPLSPFLGKPLRQNCVCLGAVGLGANARILWASNDAGFSAHTILLEYLPFIILLFALYTIAGGILVAGNIHGTPFMNVALLVLGGLLASVVGTTGASMIMIRR